MTFLSTVVIFGFMKHAHWILFSGLLWLAMGLFLLTKGFNLLTLHAGKSGVVMWLVFAFLIGYMKGRFVFSKTVTRITRRILSLPLPISFSKVYPPAYWMLIGAMGFLGMIFRYLSPEIRGFADVAVGSALFYGSLLYFQSAYQTASQQG